MLTKFNDTETYLINFFDLKSLYNYACKIIPNFYASSKRIQIKNLFNGLNMWKNSQMKYSQIHIHSNSNTIFSAFSLVYSYYAVDVASENGYIDVLNWWKDSGLYLEYLESAMDRASRNGRINVLIWWKNSGLKLKYSTNAMNWASANGLIDVLNWWKNSGLELKYSNDTMDRALEGGIEHRREDTLIYWIGG